MHATFEIGLARRKGKLERDSKHQQIGLTADVKEFAAHPAAVIITYVERVTEFSASCDDGDAENPLPPSKSAAGREISRDNPRLDDDEVPAGKRIVKARGNQSTSTPSSIPLSTQTW
ncbi:hypothetical protein D5086_017981 [Populus alba]|uniref:Uncharacterized protein n=1 Tax=Populus alba TaxID=43335 RepID=A0ACC4BQ26_POPAL